jgi:hypothetical protein
VHHKYKSGRMNFAACAELRAMLQRIGAADQLADKAIVSVPAM